MANIFDQDVNYLLRLPCEILVEILSFLDVKTVHKKVALTCKHLLKITRMFPKGIQVYHLTSQSEKLSKFPELSDILGLKLSIKQMIDLDEALPNLR